MDRLFLVASVRLKCTRATRHPLACPVTGRMPRVLIAAEQLLVGETLGVALETRGLETSCMPFQAVRPQQEPLSSDVGLLLCDAGSAPALRTAIAVVRVPVPWVVVSPSFTELGRQALLDAGARRLVGEDVSMAQIIDVLVELHDQSASQARPRP